MISFPIVHLTRSIDRVNELNRLEYEGVRDFIILHYKANQRDDTLFWCAVRNMDIPQTLQAKISAFEHDGSLIRYWLDSFQDSSWLSMYNGFRIFPKLGTQAADDMDVEQLKAALDKMKSAIQQGVKYAPSHKEFLLQI